MIAARDGAFDYDTLPLLGRLSLRLSNSLVVSHLQPGVWLDLLCGSRAMLQLSQRSNTATSRFYSLDHSLDPELSQLEFHLTEYTLGRTLPYESEMFDNITIVNGLEHLWHPSDILAECHRTLKVGGLLQVIVPTWFAKPALEFLAFRVRNKQAYREMNDHKMYYDEKIMWPMLVQAGFKPSDIRMRRAKFFCSLYTRATKAQLYSIELGDRQSVLMDDRAVTVDNTTAA